MKLIRPTVITAAMLVTSSIIEGGYSAYAAGTTYSTIGQPVARVSGQLASIYTARKFGNLLTRSRELDNASWGKTELTVTADAIVGPDGVRMADKIVPSTTAAQHYMIQNAASSGNNIMAVKAKAAGYSWLGLAVTGAAPVRFNLATGTVGTVASGLIAGMSALPDGWYLCWVKAAYVAVTSYIFVQPNDTQAFWSGDGVSGIYIDEVNLEQVTTETASGPFTTTTTTALRNLGQTPETSPEWWTFAGQVEVAYDSGTTYALNAVVADTVNHRLFKSLQAANTGHPLTDAAWWIDIGPTNKWAPFDDRVGTVARWIGSMTYQLQPGAIDSLAVLDTTAESVTVSMISGGVEVYNRTRSLNVGGQAISDWATYFFEPVGARTKLVFDDLPVFPTATVTITIKGRNTADYVTAGTIVVGRIKSLGTTEVGGEIGIVDFSRKERNQFGQWLIVERGFADRMTLRSMIDTNEADSVKAALVPLRAIPVVYIGEDGFDSLTIFGYFKDFSIDLANPRGGKSYVSTTIEGLSTSV